MLLLSLLMFPYLLPSLLVLHYFEHNFYPYLSLSPGENPPSKVSMCFQVNVNFYLCFLRIGVVNANVSQDFPFAQGVIASLLLNFIGVLLPDSCPPFDNCFKAKAFPASKYFLLRLLAIKTLFSSFQRMSLRVCNLLINIKFFFASQSNNDHFLMILSKIFPGKLLLKVSAFTCCE